MMGKLPNDLERKDLFGSFCFWGEERREPASLRGEKEKKVCRGESGKFEAGRPKWRKREKGLSWEEKKV